MSVIFLNFGSQYQSIRYANLGNTMDDRHDKVSKLWPLHNALFSKCT